MNTKSLSIRVIVGAVVAGVVVMGTLIPHIAVAQEKFCAEPSFRVVTKTLKRVVTAYTSDWRETTGIPGKPGTITASGDQVEDGVIAYNYLPLGTKVRINIPGVGYKEFVVKDRTAEGRKNFDIWMASREDALNWGAKVLTVEVLKPVQES